MQISTLKEIPSTALLRPGCPPLSFSLRTALIVLLTVVALADASNIKRPPYLHSRQRSLMALGDRSSSAHVLEEFLTPNEPQDQLQSYFQSHVQSPLAVTVNDFRDPSLENLSQALDPRQEEITPESLWPQYNGALSFSHFLPMFNYLVHSLVYFLVNVS